MFLWRRRVKSLFQNCKLSLVIVCFRVIAPCPQHVIRIIYIKSFVKCFQNSLRLQNKCVKPLYKTTLWISLIHILHNYMPEERPCFSPYWLKREPLLPYSAKDSLIKYIKLNIITHRSIHSWYKTTLFENIALSFVII